jgi:hypothetical protein
MRPNLHLPVLGRAFRVTGVIAAAGHWPATTTVTVDGWVGPSNSGAKLPCPAGLPGPQCESRAEQVGSATSPWVPRRRSHRGRRPPVPGAQWPAAHWQWARATARASADPGLLLQVPAPGPGVPAATVPAHWPSVAEPTPSQIKLRPRGSGHSGMQPELTVTGRDGLAATQASMTSESHPRANELGSSGCGATLALAPGGAWALENAVGARGVIGSRETAASAASSVTHRLAWTKAS